MLTSLQIGFAYYLVTNIWFCAQATTYVNNLLVGARNIDHRGQFHVVNLATDDSFQCSIKEPFFGKSRHEVGILLHLECKQLPCACNTGPPA